MKRFLRAAAAVLTAILLGWYCTPSVYRILHLPDVVVETDLNVAPIPKNCIPISDSGEGIFAIRLRTANTSIWLRSVCACLSAIRRAKRVISASSGKWDIRNLTIDETCASVLK